MQINKESWPPLINNGFLIFFYYFEGFVLIDFGSLSSVLDTKGLFVKWKK